MSWRVPCALLGSWLLGTALPTFPFLLAGAGARRAETPGCVIEVLAYSSRMMGYAR